MQAITTKVLLPTNTKGQRVKATCAARSVVISWEYGVGLDENHRLAAQALCDRMSWDYHFVSGTDHRGDYVHVILGATHGNTYQARETMRVFDACDDKGLVVFHADVAAKQSRFMDISKKQLKAFIDIFNQWGNPL